MASARDIFSTKEWKPLKVAWTRYLESGDAEVGVDNQARLQMAQRRRALPQLVRNLFENVRQVPFT